MNLIENLKSFDLQIFFFINNNMSNSIFDILMPLITNKNNWIIPVIIFVLYLLFLNKIKGKIVFVIILISLGINDYFCATILKPYFQRLRPSHEMFELINLLISKGGKWSMPSNHSSNMFALATIISYFYPKTKISIYLLASIISFSRVYVGVHYPLDIVFGAIIGYTISWITISVWLWIKLNQLKKFKTWVWYESENPKFKY